MSAVSDFRERIEDAFKPTPRGIIGLVDDLMRLAGQEGFRLNWHDGRCCVHAFGGEAREDAEVRVQKSVFRAVLARIAALCNEQSPNSVSPYGGEGELVASTSPPVRLRVTFANRHGEQRLQIDRAEGGA